MANAVRWTRERMDEYVRKRLARHADASFERDMAAAPNTREALGSAGFADRKGLGTGKGGEGSIGLIDRTMNRSAAARLPIAGRLYPLILLCEAYGLPAPIPEYNFSPTRAYRFDYAWPAQKIAAEIEGGIWRRGGGAHSHPSGIERDIEKYNLAAMLGWRVLRAAPEKLGTLIEPLRVVLQCNK